MSDSFISKLTSVVTFFFKQTMNKVCILQKHLNEMIMIFDFVEMSTAGPDLAEQLHKWAVEEMHFYSHGLAGGKLPTVEDFRV